MGDLLIGGFEVLFQTSGKEFGLANERRAADTPPARFVAQRSGSSCPSASCAADRQSGRRRQLRSVLTQGLVDQLVFGRQTVHQIRSHHVLAEFLQITIHFFSFLFISFHFFGPYSRCVGN